MGTLADALTEKNPAAKVSNSSKLWHKTLESEAYSSKVTFPGVGSGGGLVDVVPTSKPSNDHRGSYTSEDSPEESVLLTGVDRLPPTCNMLAPVLGMGNTPEMAEPLSVDHYSRSAKLDAVALILEVHLTAMFVVLVTLPKETTWRFAGERKEPTTNDPEKSAPLKYLATVGTKEMSHEKGVAHVLTLGLGLLAPGSPKEVIDSKGPPVDRPAREG